MGENSKIQWTDHTFNPWSGCTKVSPGCTNCYAEDLRKRFGKDEWGPNKPRARTSKANWNNPRKWNEKAGQSFGICTDCNAPVMMYGMGLECGCGVYGSGASTRRPRVFCSSLADWLDPEVPAEWLADLLDLIAATPNLDWLLLTKRPELWRERILAACNTFGVEGRDNTWIGHKWLRGNPPVNGWLGTTVEDQKRADERIPHLLRIPARVRFLSCEPLLEAVDLRRIQFAAEGECYCGQTVCIRSVLGADNDIDCPDCELEQTEPAYNEGIDWVIVGGESGPKARPFDIAWARSIVEQCRDAGVPCFVKQMGAKPRSYVVTRRGMDACGNQEDDGRMEALHLRDNHGGDPHEWPADLRVREFPASKGAK